MDSIQFEQFMRKQSELLAAIRNAVDSNAAGASANPNASFVGGTTTIKSSNEKMMETLSNSISTFSYDPENGVTFDEWYNRHEDVFTDDGKDLDDASCVRLLLRKLDEGAYNRYANFILPTKPRERLFKDTVTTLKDIFGSSTSLFAIRYNCLQLKKNETDDFLTYAGNVNRQCENFKISTIESDEFKSLMFICGLSRPNDSDIRTRLLAKIESAPKTKLTDLVSECHRIQTLKHDTEMVEKQLVDVNKIDSNRKVPKSPCWFCGALHYSKYCTYKSHKCSKCGNTGHKEGFCKNSKTSGGNNSSDSNSGSGSNSSNVNGNFHNRNFNKNRKNKSYQSNTSNTNRIFLVSQVNSHRKYITVEINSIPIRLQIDTASDITILSNESWQKIGSPQTTMTDHAARNASGDPLPLLGHFKCQMVFKGKQISSMCYISGIPSLNILGIDNIELLQLFDVPINSICNQVKSKQPTQSKSSIAKTVSTSVDTTSNVQRFVTNLKNQYSEMFDGSLGICTKAEAVLHLKPGRHPVYKPKRPVPYAAYSDIENELNRLESIGVIERVEYSQWAAPIVAVKKANGSTRICGDFSTGLNEALESHDYPLPTPEEIFTTLTGGKYFSKIDLSDAYLQVKVSDASMPLLTINTHRGLYQYRRLPFGVKSSPGIFQQIMNTMLAGLEGVISYLDDILVVAKSEKDHMTNLHNLFVRINDWGFRLKYEKCSLFQTELFYLGYIINSHGRKPDPERTKSIVNMPRPTDVTTTKSFLGMLNTYGQFLPNMRELRAPLDELTSINTKFHWSTKCEAAFQKAKIAIQSDLVLTHYDPNKPIIVAGDACKDGIGGVIMHKFPDGSKRPVAHASRSLLQAEQNYSQPEKEALALIFCIKKFHKMIHGRQFTLLTDHQPLLTIFGSKKGIPVYTANRLQRWALILRAYDFKIEYVNTTKFGFADALSRLINQTPKDDEFVIASVKFEADVNRVFSDVVSSLPVSAELITRETKKDNTLQTVLKYMLSSWPSAEKIQDETLRMFYNRRESLSQNQFCLFSQNRVVIPFSLQKKILKQLHTGHPGIVRMKALARCYVYWPNIDKDIAQTVKECSTCAAVAPAPVKAPLSSWPVPDRPWSRIHVDYAGPFLGHMYFVIVDAYCKWPEIFRMSSTTSASTIAKLREVFSRFGLPDVIVSDNGTQFSSAEFATFCAQHGVKHIRTPPFSPQCNGQAEKVVDIFKRGMKKLLSEEQASDALQTFLRTYRIIPNAQLPNNCSPAELMFGRKIKIDLDLLKPSIIVQTEKKFAMESQFNRHHGAKKRNFYSGESVYVMDYRSRNRTWAPGVIQEKIGNVMYAVKVDNHIWRRHENQIRNRSTTSAQLNVLDLFPFESPNSTEEIIAIDDNESNFDSEVSSNAENVEAQQRRYPQRKRFKTQRFVVS